MTHYINKMLFLMIEDVERSEDGKLYKENNQLLTHKPIFS